MQEATGKSVLVTGGGGGIGAEICRVLAAGSHRVAVADLSIEQASSVAEEIGGMAVELDVTSPESVSQAVAAVSASIGPVQICVNAAGFEELMGFLETDEAFQSKVLEINLGGVMRVTRAVLPAMIEAQWGRIVNIASDAGRVGSSLEGVYSGAKGGVIAFTKTIAREVARYHITANSVCPGPTHTPMLTGIVEKRPDAAKIVAAMEKAVPMKRLGRPEDIAPAVAFFCSEEASYITGQTLSVSGGLTMA